MKKQGQFEDRAAAMGRRDADRNIYKATHESKHERDRRRRGRSVVVIGYRGADQ